MSLSRPCQCRSRGWPSVQVKAFVASGDYNGHSSLGVRCSKELATAIQETTIILAKLPTLPVWRGYWRNKLGKCHSSMQGNRQLCLCQWISSLPQRHWPKKLLLMASQYWWLLPISQGLCCHPWQLCWGHPKTATWPPASGKRLFTKFPSQEFTDNLVKTHNRIFIQKTQIQL